ncbi:MAG: type II toxin-antitoxin system RelE/ParE family toxin [Terriglobales bacterium]
MHVKWLDVALDCLIAEAEYISQDSSAAADRTVAAILNAVEILKRFPASGRPGRVAGTRELVVSGTPYIVPYRVRDDTVELLLVFHATRKWPSQF